MTDLDKAIEAMQIARKALTGATATALKAKEADETAQQASLDRQREFRMARDDVHKLLDFLADG